MNVLFCLQIHVKHPWFQILKLRAATEGIAIDEDALATLAEVGANSTLRLVLLVAVPVYRSKIKYISNFRNNILVVGFTLSILFCVHEHVW